MWPVRRAARSKIALRSPGRRQFLERTATAVVAAPFVAGAYGLFYGRLNLQTTQQRIRLARLPKAFTGFRIAQLSDIHIGPFMTEQEIRKYVRITNELKPDLIALTGDFVTWDPSTQHAVVTALTGLHAPFGIFGCLGNHEAWSHTEDSITRMFHQVGFGFCARSGADLRAGRILQPDGIDFETRRHMVPGKENFVRAYLEDVERLISPDTANILMSHNPDTFDRAAELGIGLSLAGHTHGGQVALEFVSPEIAPSRLVTPYVEGWFQKPGGQLYVIGESARSGCRCASGRLRRLRFTSWSVKRNRRDVLFLALFSLMAAAATLLAIRLLAGPFHSALVSVNSPVNAAAVVAVTFVLLILIRAQRTAASSPSRRTSLVGSNGSRRGHGSGIFAQSAIAIWYTTTMATLVQMSGTTWGVL